MGFFWWGRGLNCTFYIDISAWQRKKSQEKHSCVRHCMPLRDHRKEGSCFFSKTLKDLWRKYMYWEPELSSSSDCSFLLPEPLATWLLQDLNYYGLMPIYDCSVAAAEVTQRELIYLYLLPPRYLQGRPEFGKSLWLRHQSSHSSVLRHCKRSPTELNTSRLKTHREASMLSKKGLLLQKERILFLSQKVPHIKADNIKYWSDPVNITGELNDFRKLEIKPVLLLETSLCVVAYLWICVLYRSSSTWFIQNREQVSCFNPSQPMLGTKCA